MQTISPEVRIPQSPVNPAIIQAGTVGSPPGKDPRELHKWVTSEETKTRTYEYGTRSLTYPLIISTATQMRAALEGNPVFFVPKTYEVEIPDISDRKLLDLVGEGFAPSCRRQIGMIRSFLVEREAMIDFTFREHHPDRTDWRFWMQEQYGKIFYELYWSNNQVSRNTLGRIIPISQLIARFIRMNGNAKHQETAKELSASTPKLRALCPGPEENPYDLLDPVSKVQVVRQFEKASLNILRLLAGDDAPFEMRKIT